MAHKNADKLRIFVKNLLAGDWPILCSHEQAFQGPQGQTSILLHANHQWQKNLFKDPEVPLAAESGS
jgi:hypothetical protein